MDVIFFREPFDFFCLVLKNPMPKSFVTPVYSIFETLLMV